MSEFVIFLSIVFIINIFLIINMYFLDKFKFKKMLKNFLLLISVVYMNYICNLLYEYYLAITNPFKMMLGVCIAIFCLIEVIEQVKIFVYKCKR